MRLTYVESDPLVTDRGLPRYPNGFYRCSLWRANGDTLAFVVGAPNSLSHAVDSSEAFDDAARAALAFASHGDSEWGDTAAYDAEGSGFHVGRSPATAWPIPLTGEVSILSIDAWNSPEGWTWNQWFKRGTCDASIADRSPREILAFMREQGYTSEASKGRTAIEDDGYNVVILDRSTRKPLFAIAYGEAIDADDKASFRAAHATASAPSAGEAPPAPLAAPEAAPAVWADGFGRWHARVSRAAASPLLAARKAIRAALEARDPKVAPHAWRDLTRVEAHDTPETVVYAERVDVDANEVHS